jgi:hypothetical protein
MYRKNGASTKICIEPPMSANDIEILSSSRPRRSAAIMPRPTPKTTNSTTAPIASDSVTGRRFITVSSTGWRLTNE